MVQHPARFFLKFLITQEGPNAKDNAWVTFYLESLGFPKGSRFSAFLQDLRAEVTPKIPAGYQPNNRYHRESVRFLRSEGIWALHNPDAATREAASLVTNIKVRQVVEQLLLGRLDEKEIAKKVNSRFGERYTAAGIEAFKHYYWNVEIMRVEDWVPLFDDYEKWAASRHNSIIHSGASMALHMNGFQQQIETKTMLSEMMESIYFDFKDWKAQPRSETKSRALSTLAKAATMLDGQLSQADSAVKESLKAFEQFRMKHAEAVVPDIREIAPDGNYTNSGSKLLEPRTEESSPSEEPR